MASTHKWFIHTSGRLSRCWVCEVTRCVWWRHGVLFLSPRCKMVANPVYIPRLEEQKRACCLRNSCEQAFACSRMASREVWQLFWHYTISSMTEKFLFQLFCVDTTTTQFMTCFGPSRQTAQYVAYTWDIATQLRACPQPEVIEEHLNETIVFQGHLERGDQVCYSCYILIFQWCPVMPGDFALLNLHLLQGA